MSQKAATSQDVQESNDHDHLPEALLTDNLTRDDAVKLLIKYGLAVAPDAQQTADNMNVSSRGRGQGRGQRRGRGRGVYRGRGQPRGGGEALQQRQRSMVEELSAVSASQSQIKDISAEIADLNAIGRTNMDSIAKLSARVDSISTRQTTDIANLRQSVASLAGDFGDIKNLIAHFVSRGDLGNKATYPTMSAGELAAMTLESGRKVTGKEEITLKGAGVPARAYRISGEKPSASDPALLRTSSQQGAQLKGGIILSRGNTQVQRPSVRPTAATRPSRPSMASPLAKTSSDKPAAPVTDIDDCVERFGPTSVQIGKKKEAEENLIDLHESWDEQVESYTYDDAEGYEEGEYEDDEDNLYADYQESQEESNFVFEVEE